MVLGLAITGTYELYHMLQKKGYRVYFILPLLLNIFILTSSYLLADSSTPTNPSWRTEHYRILAFQHMLLIFSFFTMISMNLFLKPRATIAEMTSSIFQIIYMGWFPSFLILMHFLPQGPYFLAWTLTSTAFSDICGYFAGRAFGKRAFFEHLSPKKTLAGSIGGVLGCTTVAFMGHFFLPISWWHSLILGVAFACIGQIGDLVESLVKRDAEVKDSGNVIPGHGGILDRVDSYAVVGFLSYFYLIYFVLR